MPSVQKFPKTGAELCKLSKKGFQKITGDSHSAAILDKHLAFMQGKLHLKDEAHEEDFEVEELGDDQDDISHESSSQSSQKNSKTVPNIIGKILYFC